MGQIHCKKCGEPWEIYSLRHEVPDWDDQPDDAYEKFMRGGGCPTCGWGEEAGEVSLSRSMSEEELTAQFQRGLFNETDEDPLKYL